MTHPNPSTALARVIVDELAANGVEVVIISPGSRSAALAIAAGEHQDIEVRVVIDERSAGFHALGVARGTGRPVTVVSTSGTAPANFFPAVVEADMSCVPLIAVSADRPAEMQGIGANQTIDQNEMFGAKVRGFSAIEAPDSTIDANEGWRDVVARLVALANGPRPGPVHLNVAFREPTVPVSDDGRARAAVYPFATPRVGRGLPGPRTEDQPIPELTADRGLVIAGDGSYDREALTVGAARLGWPVLATALSGMRGGEVVSSYHHMLGEAIPAGLTPETVVAVGAIGPSSALERLVASARRRVRVDLWGRPIDPGRNATDVLAIDPVRLLSFVSGAAEPAWSRTWQDADRVCLERIVADVEGRERMSGGGVAVALNSIPWESLVVASSLPIREVDAHLTRRGPVFANRGASGIDGFVSTALGVASARPGTLALSGDLSLLHDSNGFLHDARIDLTIVVIDNRGGGLFDSLPLAAHAPDYERLFVTAPHREPELLAAFHGLRFSQAPDVRSLIEMATTALERGGTEVISVPVDRRYDLAVRPQLGL
jgi:2-succinyl-5-enolpyruvyl-6-hydroxy-3-cyclohexene-1-carboxylate synthase